MFYFANTAVFVAIMVLVALYVYWRSGSLIEFYGGSPAKWYMRLVRAAAALAIGYLCRNTWNKAAMVLLHFLASFLILDLMALILRRILRKKKETKYYDVFHRIYRSGFVPVVLFVILMVYGYYNMNHIRKTEYEVATVKEIQNYDVVLLTDIHYGTVQNPNVLQEKVVDINAQNPDIVILGGDIVEEGTSKEELEEVFVILGHLKNKYGIFYVYGNHDRQPYTSERTYTNEELEEVIEKNGIQILRDRYIEINDDLVIAGRDDAAWSGMAERKSSQEIYEGLSKEDREKKFMLMVDHQPIQVEENGQEGVDLQLSGHTHAGQIWPVGYISEMAGILNYGIYQRGICRAVVSSGVAGWRYMIRTGEHCEYVMIHLHQ